MLLTYLIGCLWWFYVSNINSFDDISNNNTFITKYAIDEIWLYANTDPYCSRTYCSAELFKKTPIHYCFNLKW